MAFEKVFSEKVKTIPGLLNISAKVDYVLAAGMWYELSLNSKKAT